MGLIHGFGRGLSAPNTGGLLLHASARASVDRECLDDWSVGAM